MAVSFLNTAPDVYHISSVLKQRPCSHCFSLGGLIQIKDKSKAYNTKVVPNLLEKLPLTFSQDT